MDNKKSKKENRLQLFQNQSVRTHWDEGKELWYFSVVDVVAILTVQQNYQTARKYWNKLKERLKKEGNETVTNCHQLKMLAKDGKMRMTDVADTEQLLRLIQSVPSSKAEPFKLWLAKVGYERIEETEDPELAFDRAMETYLAKGYSKNWINQRLKSIEVRKELTDEWNERGMKQGLEYAILTNELTKAWAGKNVKDYKKIKGLKKENLRDNMSNLELVLNMLAEASTTEISKEKQPEGLEENKSIARKGDNAAKKARLEIEKQTGKPIVSAENSKNILDKPDNKKIRGKKR
ncbi:MAG: Bro-N domain-containing protein [Bacteroidales bacterium]|nr:Bro-N domain-containing protein [Bacteroidales bacterium]